MDYSNHILELMRIKNWTQTQLATAGGVSQGTISRYLSGKGIPDVDFLMNLLINEKVDPLWFFTNINEKNPKSEKAELQSDFYDLVESETKFRRKITRRPKVYEFINEILDLTDEDVEMLREMAMRFKKNS
uniref:HTH cro/C1-type domain-containing protein n=1 Tax=Leptospira ellisii TaxID=2023197 RepID=A0A2N0BAB6_9LEPT|nr:helix-turn-helix transcriptional regulator [Leptospira ellisii]PJZ93446.1 hypothetical protein CH379_07855 [Leptospira ellisii]